MKEVTFLQEFYAWIRDTFFNNDQIDCIIHEAAQVNVRSSMEDPRFDAINNIGGTIELLELCKRFNVV